MLEKIKWTINDLAVTTPDEGDPDALKLLTPKAVQEVRDFHRSMPAYEPTPLTRLHELAGSLGLKELYVKDESYRFGLNAFKVLGGSFAIARYITDRLGRDIASLTYEELISPETKAQIGSITFYTTTDGNHGRGVAWAANKLNQKSVVCMPVGSSDYRLQAIKNEGADAWITNMNYDDAVRYVNSLAEADENGVMVQDTAWPGYDEIPGWIMQGYATMVAEALEQMAFANAVQPTHVFVQAGVGSLAGAVQGYLANYYGAACPVTTVVEASAADCLYRSVLAKELVAVGGDLNTIMAGLACGEGNTISWEILKAKSKLFVSTPDWVSGRGMRLLAAPLGTDARVTSGESGAVCVGLVATVMTNPDYQDLRDALGLDAESVVLCFSTEGDTDPQKYRSIVWDGFNPSFE